MHALNRLSATRTTERFIDYVTNVVAMEQGQRLKPVYAIVPDQPIEEQVIEAGNVRNTLLNDYLVPLATTVPRIEPIIVEGYAPSGPVGGKGVGEHALLGVAPAIANAVQAAVGVRVHELPLSPERVLEALGRQVPASDAE